MSRVEAVGEQTFDSLDAMMQAWAEEAVRVAADEHGMTLDYTAESVGRLEAVMAALGPVQPEEQEQATRLWGAYLGEVFRRRFPGEWVMALHPGQSTVRQDAEMAMPALEIGGSQVYPLLKVYRRLTMGPGEDLAAFYGKVAGALEAKRERG